MGGGVTRNFKQTVKKPWLKLGSFLNISYLLWLIIVADAKSILNLDEKAENA